MNCVLLYIKINMFESNVIWMSLDFHFNKKTILANGKKTKLPFLSYITWPRRAMHTRCKFNYTHSNAPCISAFIHSYIFTVYREIFLCVSILCNWIGSVSNFNDYVYPIENRPFRCISTFVKLSLNNCRINGFSSYVSIFFPFYHLYYVLLVL